MGTSLLLYYNTRDFIRRERLMEGMELIHTRNGIAELEVFLNSGGHALYVHAPLNEMPAFTLRNQLLWLPT